MKNPAPNDPVAVLQRLAKDPGRRQIMLNQLEDWVDHKENHELYLNAFFRRLGAVVALLQVAPQRLESRLLAAIDEHFEPFARDLDGALEEIYTIFHATELHRKIKAQVCRNLKESLTGDADDCVAYMYETLIQRAGSYDREKATVKSWVLGDVRYLVIEWLQSKKGRGGNPAWEIPEADWLGASEGDQVQGVIDGTTCSAPTPGEEVESNDDRCTFYTFLDEHLKGEDSRLLELSDMDGLPSLTVALELGFQPDIDHILNQTAKVLCCCTDGNTTPKSILPLVAAAQAAGIGMDPGGAPSVMAKRLGDAARKLNTVGKVLEKLGNQQIADRIRQRLKNLHKRVRGLIAGNLEIRLVCDGIQERADNRGQLGAYIFDAASADVYDPFLGNGPEWRQNDGGEPDESGEPPSEWLGDY